MHKKLHEYLWINIHSNITIIFILFIEIVERVKGAK